MTIKLIASMEFENNITGKACVHDIDSSNRLEAGSDNNFVVIFRIQLIIKLDQNITHEEFFSELFIISEF